jgi:hypothetical protein
MNKSNKLQAALMLGALVGVAGLSVPTHAQSTDTSTVSLTLTGGALTIDSPTSVSLTASGALSNTPINASGNVDTVTITDTRGSFAGWSSSVKLTNLTGQTRTGEVILLASESPIAGSTTKYLTVTPATTETVSGQTTGLDTALAGVGQVISTLSSLDGSGETVGESNQFTIATASSGNGAGTYTADVGLDIGLPAYGFYPGSQKIGAQTYTGTLTAQVS